MMLRDISGSGVRLMIEFIDWIRINTGFKRVWLTVEHSNTIAQGLYTKVGFKPICRKHFKHFQGSMPMYKEISHGI